MIRVIDHKFSAPFCAKNRCILKVLMMAQCYMMSKMSSYVLPTCCQRQVFMPLKTVRQNSVNRENKILKWYHLLATCCPVLLQNRLLFAKRITAAFNYFWSNIHIFQGWKNSFCYCDYNDFSAWDFVCGQNDLYIRNLHFNSLIMYILNSEFWVFVINSNL